MAIKTGLRHDLLFVAGELSGTIECKSEREAAGETVRLFLHAIAERCFFRE